MLILGIDPGLVNTGFAIIDSKGKQKFSIIKHGVIKTKSNVDISIRLSFILDELKKHLDHYNFEYAALEKTLINKNAFSSMDLAIARGIVLLYFGQRKVQYEEYLPTSIKKMITGNGDADKESMRSMMKHYIDFENSIDFDIGKISHHEIDSIAIAISCGFSLKNF